MDKIILETAVNVFTEELIKEGVGILDFVGKEIKQKYNKGLKDYFEKQQSKYAFVKTLLHGNIPVYLYDIYFPLRVSLKNKIVTTDKVENLFNETNYITIIGKAGSGKSTLIKHLFLSSIVEKYAIPILIELRYLNDSFIDIEEYIKTIIFENKISESDSILNRLLRKGRFIFFLDGFDEIIYNVKDEMIKEVNKFVNKYHKNKFILTSRPYSNIEFMPLFYNCELLPLSVGELEVEKFVELQLKSEPELAKKILQSIKSIASSNKKYIESFLSNPLLLSLYILTFQSNPQIPDRKYIFYRRVIQALFSEHDSKSKLGFVREKRSGLSQEQFETILKRFCFLSFFDNKFIFDLDYVNKKIELIRPKLKSIGLDTNKFIEDLKLALALWVEEGNELKFIHRSLQEYFASIFISDLKETQKKLVYEKVISSLNEISEIDNFLSLCEELDEVDYLKYFMLPVIDSILERYRVESDEELIEKFVSYSYTEIGTSEHGHSYHTHAADPMRKIRHTEFFFKDIRVKLDEFADRMTWDNKIINNTKNWTSFYGYEGEQAWGLNLKEGISTAIIDYLKEQNFDSLIKEVIRNLEGEKERIKNYINEVEKNNDDLIGLI